RDSQITWSLTHGASAIGRPTHAPLRPARRPVGQDCPAARAMSAVRQPTIACSSTRSSIAIARASRGVTYLSATDIGRLFTDGTGDGAKVAFSCGFSRL